MRSWIATLVATTFLTGCCCRTQATRTSDDRIARIEDRLAPAPTPTPAPSYPAPGPVMPAPPAVSGAYDDGVRAGERDAKERIVAGYGVLGFLTAPLLLLCLLAALGGGSGGNFGSGSSFRPDERPSPPDAAMRTPEYNDGYATGYSERLETRRETAFTGGLIAGFLVIGGVLLFLVIDDKRREDVEESSGNHMTARRRGVPLLEF